MTIASMMTTTRLISYPRIQTKSGIMVKEAMKVISQKESHLRLLFLEKVVETKGTK
jgi:hypothetical protein